MKNKFKKDHLIMDFILNNRWWIRLLKIIFLFSFALACYNKYLFLFYDNSIPQWKEVESVKNRLTSDVKLISEIKENWERVAQKNDSDKTTHLNSNDDSLYANLYGSTELGDKISEIQKLTGVTDLRLSGKKVSIDYFSNYIKTNNVNILLVDNYFSFDSFFLRPFTEIYEYELFFYKKDPIDTAVYISKNFLIIVFIFSAIAYAYHRFIFFIASGRVRASKNLNNE